MGFDYSIRLAGKMAHDLSYGERVGRCLYMQRNIFGAGRLADAVLEMGMGFDPWAYGIELPPFPKPEDFGVVYNEDHDWRDEDSPEWLGDRVKEYRAAVDYVLDWHGISDIPGIPVHKLCYSNDGWHVTALECEAALGIYREKIAAGAEHPVAFHEDFIPFLEQGAANDGFESW